MDNFKAFLTSSLGKVVVTIVSAVVIYGLILLAVSIESTFFAFVIFGCCTYFGWKALNFITPNIFLIMPLAGWAIYCVVKGILSFFLGFLVAPFQIGAMISKSVSNSVAAK